MNRRIAPACSCDILLIQLPGIFLILFFNSCKFLIVDNAVDKTADSKFSQINFSIHIPLQIIFQSQYLLKNLIRIVEPKCFILKHQIKLAKAINL